jgi:hypothetical protein
MVLAAPRCRELRLVVTATREEKCYSPRCLMLYADREHAV